VAQLESMVETAPRGELEGVRLEKGGDIAKLHSAADKGAPCVVHKEVRAAASPVFFFFLNCVCF
jgi:hypothetical protein